MLGQGTFAPYLNSAPMIANLTMESGSLSLNAGARFVNLNLPFLWYTFAD